MFLHDHLVGLLIIVFLAVVQSQPQVVFISPDPETLPCLNGFPCMNLSQYALQLSDHFASETTLRFLPGNHLLTRVLNATNLSRFTMLRAFNTSRNIKISCLHGGHFEFSSILTLHLSDLQLDGCNSLVHNGLTSDRARGLVIADSDVTISDCTFSNNKAGALLIKNSIVTIISSKFNNNCDQLGGSVFVDTNSIVSIANSTFGNNRALLGGGSVFIYTNSTVSITSSTFHNNTADMGGGGLYAYSNNDVSITNSTFEDNNAVVGGGGAVVDTNNSVYIINSTFSNNNAGNGGGGMVVISSNIVCIKNSSFNYNNADAAGGGVLIHFNSTVSIINSTFDNNSAGDDRGAVIFVQQSTVEFRGRTNMRGNKGNQSIVYVVQSSVSFSGHTNIENNNGSVFALSSNISFHGRTWFYQNVQPRNSLFQGGLFTTLKCNVSFMGDVEMLNNTADTGGAISAIQSNVYIYGKTFIEHNNARFSGGGIYAYLSQVDFSVMNCTIRGNTAIGEGGGIHAVGSTVSLSKGVSVLITENTADQGGGMYLELNAKLIIFTEDSKNRNSLTFTHNVAQQKGGAIYVADNTLSGTCAQTGSSSVMNECFFQALALYSYSDPPHKDTVFFNNTANEGETLYGGLLDRCSISPFVEDGHHERDKYKDAVGSDYFQDVTKIQDYKDNSITSDPLRICLCNDNKPNCTIRSHKLHVKKGHTFKLFVAAVDQVTKPFSAPREVGIIFHSYLSNAPQGSHLIEGQTTQHKHIHNGSCTQLQYNIISQQSSEELVLYVEGPCKDVGISRSIISVEFLPCTCPDGFVSMPSHDNCSCKCDPKLLRPQRYVDSCSSINSTLLRSGTSWINYVSNCTNFLSYRNSSVGYVVSLYCPYDYCQPAELRVDINISMPNGSDAQCAFNRSGKLCGSCDSGLSHSLGSSQCMHCTNYWLLLLLPFSLAGIVLVVFILMFKLTVATGTINGLIFYANLITANRSILLPFDKPNILTVFIAWLNLDLGIETCFYNGMDAYAKAWLQFAFPVYIILLIFVIIVVCNWSERFAKLIGSKNPVATLATLFLLSYTKLLRLIIIALDFTYLDHLNDGSKELVWLYDANVAYLKGKHIPLFVAAIFIVVFGVIYTSLLLFWQWLQHCSNWRVLKWLNNTKLKALMDAYHAPYQSKHRYWPGLLLLIRVVLYLVSTLNFSRDPSVNLLFLICILTVLLLVKLVCTQSQKIYKKWGLDILDTFCILNLLVFVNASSFLLYLHAVNVELHKRSLQISLAYSSISISFGIFLTLLVYHLYTACLKKCKLFEHTTRNFKQHRTCNHDIFPNDINSDEEASNLRMELRDIITDPPNANDYRQLAAATLRARAMERRRARANKQEVTHTVVEIPRPELPLSVQIRHSPNVDCPLSQSSPQSRDPPNVDCPPSQPSPQIRDYPNVDCQKNFVI